MKTALTKANELFKCAVSTFNTKRTNRQNNQKTPRTAADRHQSLRAVRIACLTILHLQTFSNPTSIVSAIEGSESLFPRQRALKITGNFPCRGLLPIHFSLVA